MGAALSREAVVAATRDLIVRDGLDAVSLRRVGAALDVTAPALYAYVSDKRDLLRAIAEEEFGKIIAKFSAVEATDPVDRIRAYSRAYIDYARANPELFRVIFLFQPDLGTGPVPGGELLAANEAFVLPASAVADAIESGRFRPIDPLLASMTLWTSVHGAATVLLMGFDFSDSFEEQLTESVIETFIAGLAA